MEALAAFGLAANVAQFICIAGKTVEMTLELARSKRNLLEENADLEKIVQSFKNAVPQIKNADSVAIGNDYELKSLVQDANRLAGEIQTRLDGIKTRRAKSRHRAERLITTLKELEMKEKLRYLGNQLASFRSEITLHIKLKLIQQQEQIMNSLVSNSESNRCYRKEIQSQLNELINNVNILIVPGGRDAEEDRRVWKGNSMQLQDLINQFRSWHPRALDFQKVRRIMSDLQFIQIEERRNAIPQAHRNTYKWILDGEVANLKTWLQTENAPIYWITGNAGSGKSTLMKHIYEHPRLNARLKEWVGDRRLYIACHFCWSGGTTLQQSQEGLLRTLLFQILLERLDLVSSVFPVRWNRLDNNSDMSSLFGWTIKELLDGLFSLPQVVGPDRLFILIDGLDEYNGEHDELLNKLKSLGEASCIKLCLSSRPWLDFIDAFEDSPWKLYLQDLTRPDIATYIQDELTSHSRFEKLRLQNEEAAEGLVEKIATRAQGVFLWVYLVVKSMIRGLINSDSMRDLHRRLDDLPQQLEDFFDRILDSVDDFYRVRTARVLLSMAHARTPIPLISFYFLDHEEDLPFDPESFLKSWPQVNRQELQVIDTKKRQLIAQCRDLVQIIEKPGDPIMFNFSASFLHRTVIDFINHPRIAERLAKDAGEGFNPVTTLFETNARQFRSLIHLLPRVYLKPYLRVWYLASIYYAREIEVSLHKSMTLQLDEMTKSLISYLEKRSSTAYSFKQAFFKLLGDETSTPRLFTGTSLLDLSICCGLRLYVSDKFQNTSQIPKPFLLQTLNPELLVDKGSGFLIQPVSKNLRLSRRPIPSSAKPTYDTTLQMYTDEDESILQELKSKESLMPPLPRVRVSIPERRPKIGRFKRIWRRVSGIHNQPTLRSSSSD
ncbi:hypothetical protein F4805DRAFT_374882 [Annulohypoxylon moriforme]|nr:hypothetical protein F4805DRAFT_374882 [Annulohypoxylon moriforme]